MQPKITVVIPTYRPGAGIQRVVDSLDAQTLPADDFEVVIVDDGSPDDTYARLQQIAATRPNYRVTQIENSGWPSTPRNLATSMASGQYVFYMDHDDSLYPDALRRLVEYGDLTGADLISPKESKTSDVWWSIPAMTAGNASDIKERGAIGRLLPMVPHKAYRREFLLENQITFPPGRRMLWEDIYFNVEAYARAQRVAVLTDTPVYLWHASATNNSSSYGASDAEFWDRLDALMTFIDTTLTGTELADARRAMLMHMYQGRVLRRLSRALTHASPEATREAMRRARIVQEAYIPSEWDTKLGTLGQCRAHFLRQDRPDLLRDFHQASKGLSARTTVTRLEWHDGVLQIDADAKWLRTGAHTLGLIRDGDRILLDLPHSLADALPPTLLDVTDRVSTFSMRFAARARAEHVTWELPATSTVTAVDGEDGKPVIVASSRLRFDPATAACDRPLPDAVWDIMSLTRWEGASHASPVLARTAPLPALIGERAGVAYANRSGGLSVDLAHRLRSAVLDGGVRWGPVRQSPPGFVIPLPAVAVFGDHQRPANIVLNGSGPTAREVEAALIGDAAGARLEIAASIPPGWHRLSVRSGEGTVRGKLLLRSTRTGRLWIIPAAQPGWARRVFAVPGRAVRRLARRLRRR